MTVTAKRAIAVLSILGFVALTLSAQIPTPRPAENRLDVPMGAYVPAGPQSGVLGDSVPRSGLREATGDYQIAGSVYYGSSYGQNAEEMQLAQLTHTLVKQLAKADGQEKEKIKASLTEALDKQFDLRQKRNEAEVAALESHVKKLKEIVQKRQENRRDIVSKRLAQLVGEAEGLGW
jgi:S-formylglutathione hydrolase FrmB